MEPFVFDQVNWLIFCAESCRDSRYSIFTPFVFGGHLYATDGQVCIRRPTGLPDTDKADRKIPGQAMLDAFDRVIAQTVDWKCLGTDAMSMPVRLTACECRHRSRFDAPCDQCPQCAGTGRVFAIAWWEATRIGDATVTLANWNRVATLPAIEYGQRAGVGSPIPLRFTGGDGLLMPLDEAGDDT